MSRQRFAATVIEDVSGERQVVGRFPSKWQAERAAIVKSLQPGFSHGQVDDTQ